MTTPPKYAENPAGNVRRGAAWLLIDKVGAIGGFLAAAAAPCCFPLLAGTGAALGLGALEPLRGYVDSGIQAMAVLALIGNLIAYRQHYHRGPLAVSVGAAAVIFVAYHSSYHVSLVYIGLFGLMVAAVWNVIAKRGRADCCRAN